MSRPKHPQALTIASSDSGGGAGIQADIKAMQANGVFALSVIVAITAQNTQTVSMVHALPRDIIETQIEAVFDDFEIGAVKTGMLFSSEIVDWVSALLKKREAEYLVVDPVMTSKDGTALLKPDAVETMKKKLFPLATLVTPNIQEAENLAGTSIHSLKDVEEAARRIHGLGPRNVLVKGGHLESDPGVDILFDGKTFAPYPGEWIVTKNTHGTGCTYSAAISAQLARGSTLRESIASAKTFITEAIRHARAIGGGSGPVHPFYKLDDH